MTLQDQEEVLHKLVAGIANRAPDRLAVKFGGEAVSYAQLTRRANRLAHRLIGRGVELESPIGVCLDRSIGSVVALLGILRAGGACVPLDPTYPRERIELMLADCRPPVIVTERMLAGCLVGSAADLIFLDQEDDLSALAEDDPPDVAVSGRNLAYLLYTSGSSGRPKAVAMEHGAFNNLLKWQVQNFAAAPAAKTLQFASLNFDVAFQEVFSTLFAGGTVVIISEETRRDPSALLRFVQTEEIERLFMPFVALQTLTMAAELEGVNLASLREVITAGEQLKITPEVRSFFARHPACVLQNQYGPTETHVATAYTMQGDPAEWPALPPIGTPIRGVKILVLDEELQPVSPGRIGEIYIGGSGLARGYLNRPDLTGELFVSDPSSREAGAHVYKTGDLGRYLPDGSLEFIGRRDDQVKVRGERVELGEIEAAILDHSGVWHAAVIAEQESPYGARLAAYFVPKAGQTLTGSDLRAFLGSKVSESRIPSVFIELEQMPLTPSGKLDRGKLPAPPTHRPGPVAAARDSLERALIAVVEKVLGVQPVGIADNFFELGGHSLLAAHVAFEIRENQRIQIDVAAIFKHPTIADLAEHLRRLSAPEEDSRIIALNEGGGEPALFCVPALLDLGRRLGPDHPFYGLELREFARSTDHAVEAIRELAGRGLELVRSVKPKGPYFLGGYSFGGPVAFEMARQLRAQGEEVGLLVLIDPDPPKPADAVIVKRHLFAGWHRMLRNPRAAVTHYWRALTRRTAIAVGEIEGFSSLQPEDKVLNFAMCYPAVKIDCRLALFLAESPNPKDWEIAEGRREWIELASRGAEVVSVPGDHASLVEWPLVTHLGERLRGSLTSAHQAARRSE